MMVFIPDKTNFYHLAVWLYTKQDYLPNYSIADFWGEIWYEFNWLLKYKQDKHNKQTLA